jgi:hypothetical protein
MIDFIFGLILFILVLYLVYKTFSRKKQFKIDVGILGAKEIKQRNLSPMAWVIIIFNVYMVYRLLAGLYEIGLDGQSDSVTGVTAFFFIMFWLLLLTAINVVLYVLFRVTSRKKKRVCPACGSNVQVGITICQQCKFNFTKAAGGE